MARVCYFRMHDEFISDAMTVAKLQQVARVLDVRGRSRLRKANLLRSIQRHMAAQKIQRAWRRRKAIVNDVDPITLEKSNRTDCFLHVISPRVVYAFDPAALSEACAETLRFENPVTRIPFSRVEVVRLQRLSKIPNLVQRFDEQDSLRLEMRQEQQRLTVLQTALENCVRDVINLFVVEEGDTGSADSMLFNISFMLAVPMIHNTILPMMLTVLDALLSEFPDDFESVMEGIFRLLDREAGNQLLDEYLRNILSVVFLTPAYFEEEESHDRHMPVM